MKLFFWFFVLIPFGSQAVEISFEGLPRDYNVYEWTDSPQQMEHYQAGRYSRITINLPDEFVRRTDSGAISLVDSLEAWRRGTPRGPSYPYTAPDGIARFPFYVSNPSYDSDQSLPPNARLSTYISLSHLASRAGQLPNLRFSAHNGESVVVESFGVVDRLNRIKSRGGPVNCDKASNQSNVPNWTTEECLLCNCANEAGHESERGRQEVQRVILRRVVSSVFPNSICGVVLQDSQFSWAKNDRWQTHNRLPDSNPGSGELLNRCVDSTIAAINSGPGNFDHYYNPALAAPDWASRALARERIGNHSFLRKHRLNNANADALARELRGSGGVIERPIAGMEPATEEVEVQDDVAQ